MLLLLKILSGMANSVDPDQSYKEQFDLRGMVGWCEGAVYLTSPGRPTDIG